MVGFLERDGCQNVDDVFLCLFKRTIRSAACGYIFFLLLHGSDLEWFSFFKAPNSKRRQVVVNLLLVINAE